MQILFLNQGRGFYIIQNMDKFANKLNDGHIEKLFQQWEEREVLKEYSEYFSNIEPQKILDSFYKIANKKLKKELDHNIVWFAKEYPDKINQLEFLDEMVEIEKLSTLVAAREDFSDIPPLYLLDKVIEVTEKTQTNFYSGIDEIMDDYKIEYFKDMSEKQLEKVIEWSECNYDYGNFYPLDNFEKLTGIYNERKIAKDIYNKLLKASGGTLSRFDYFKSRILENIGKFEGVDSNDIEDWPDEYIKNYVKSLEEEIKNKPELEEINKEWILEKKRLK